MIFGQPIFRYNAVASTQDVARDLLRAGEPAGTAVVARSQTKGRGRRGREWHAPPDANLNLTAICPDTPHGTAWQIALLAGVAVANAIRTVDSCLDARVRFPNDVLLGGRKVAGVLVETVAAGDADCVVPLLGIGVNVKRGDLPPEIARRATQIETEIGRDVSVAEVEAAVLDSLGACWQEWTDGGAVALIAAWKSLAAADAPRTFVLDGQPAVCRVRDIAPDGSVTLEGEDGSERTITAAQIILGDD